eukprot:jgi/Botrbrau1/17597/Bobra.0166s0036.1
MSTSIHGPASSSVPQSTGQYSARTFPVARITSSQGKDDFKLSTPTQSLEPTQGSSPRPSRRRVAVDTPFAEDETADAVGKEESTWITRVQSKTDELRKLFGLPASENVLEDFHCALQKTILLQGRMYVFEHYVCFYSNLFGYSKIKTIPLKDVTSVRKRKNYGFPNTVEIIWRGKKEFFTSFLSRDDAYRLIIIAWHQSSGYAKLFGAPIGEAGAALRPSQRLRSRLRPGSSPQTSGADGTVCGAQVSTSAPSMTPQVRRLQDEEGSYSSDASPAASVRDEDEGDALELGADEGDSESEGESEGPRQIGEWTLEDGPAPAVPAEMTPVMSAQLDVSVRDFYERFLADQSKFFLTFHEKRNDKKVQLSDWRQHHNMGRVRELQFVSQVKAKLGPPQAHCLQIQRYRIFRGDHLVFETTQVMNDIPFGDHFSVETRWDITPVPLDPSGTQRCQVQTYVAIPFSKGTIWKKAIEKGTLDSCKESHSDWLAQASKALEPVILPNASVAATQVQNKQRRQSFGTRSDEGPDVDELLRKIEPQFHADMARMLRAASAPSPRRTVSDKEENMHPGWRRYLHVLLALQNSAAYAVASQPLLTLSMLLILVMQLVLLLNTHRVPQQPAPPWASLAPNWNVATSSIPKGNMDFWVQRIAFLQSQLMLLQRQVEVLQANIGSAAQELQLLSNLNGTGDVPILQL